MHRAADNRHSRWQRFFYGLDRSINFDGTRIAFTSSSDIVPGGNSDGNLELFLFDVPSGSFTQITDTLGFDKGVSGVTIDAGGTHIAFHTTALLLGGTNLDEEPAVFLFDTATSNLIQVTPFDPSRPDGGVPCGPR